MSTASPALPNSIKSEIEALVRSVVAGLGEVTPTERVFERGAVHAGGPHYRIAGTLGPISIGEDECAAFGRAIAAFRPARCFVIGNAFGLSSVFIAKAMELHGGVAVVTLDNQSEGDGARCLAVACALRDRLDARLLTNRIGSSPEDVGAAAGAALYDLVLIDGLHQHPQVTRDLEAVQPLLHAESIVCWHDYWLPGIPESVAHAETLGFHCWKVNTSCEVVLGTRSTAAFERLRALFPSGELPVPRVRPGAYLRLGRDILRGLWTLARARQPFSRA
jgi:predicted O-methyltransferase YrrM